VFGLGALLAVILTGKPPYAGESFEAVRVQAARGKLEDCLARLDASGAEPELLAVCKQCLAFEPADRPADAGAVAAAVAGLRAAADERARRAELERVRLEGERATALARSAERRKRRRLALGAAAVLAVAAVGGLLAVLAVQRRANAELADKNAELADEQAKVEARNKELAAEQAKVQARFELAQKAIALFHTGVSEDALLKNAEFKELRTKLLKEAAGFYGDLEKLLAGQTDAKSRKALAAAYFQLGELTGKIGSKAEALAVHRQALALRRELAAEEGADVETRLDVARSLGTMGWLLHGMGNTAEERVAWQEQRDIATALEAESATDAVRAVLAQSYDNIGLRLTKRQNLTEALQAHQKALAIWQKLTDANPAVTEFQRYLAANHHQTGLVLALTGEREEAMVSFGKSVAILQNLADANPDVTKFQVDLAGSHIGMAPLLSGLGQPERALTEHRKALAIQQKLADAYPAVTAFQTALCTTYHNIGVVLVEPAAALQAHQKALAIEQKLADAHPAATELQDRLAFGHMRIGDLLSETGRPEEAMDAYRKALAIRQKVSDANPTVPFYQSHLATTHDLLGRLLARQERFAEAFTHSDAGVAIRQKLAEADPKNMQYITDLGFSHAYRGWALVRAGRPSKAAADLRRTVELWAKDPFPYRGTRFEQSRALALLAGLGGGAKSGVTTAEAAAHADQAVAALRDAIKAGWNEPDELKEPDFDAVRGGDDFKKLLAELEAKAGPKAKPKD
jgi:tetratricopeptide (TPR) repeat protein